MAGEFTCFITRLAMQATRQRILEILKERDTATVEELATQLELTPVTIRHHLDILRSEGLVQAPLVKRRETPGRPQHIYGLTDAAEAYFPKNYAGFTNLMLSEMRDQIEPPRMHSILDGMAMRMAAKAPAAPPNESLPQRMERVVKFLNTQGYDASWESSEGGCLLHARNCPYRDVTRENAEPCIMDAAMITQLTGTVPQRLQWSFEGDNMCTYFIKK
jgi:predicted ArsR family transcriptional regulator